MVFVLYCFGVGGSGGATFAVLSAVVVGDGGAAWEWLVYQIHCFMHKYVGFR